MTRTIVRYTVAQFAVAAFFVGVSDTSAAPLQSVPTHDEYAKIDVRLMNETIEKLTHGNAAVTRRTVKQIETAPHNYAPPVFFVLSNRLFQDGRKDEAAFWFYAGQLRASFDANRCAEITARRSVEELSRLYGSNINKHALQDVSKLEAMISKVVEWDRTTPHSYDHRWINLRGMNAALADAAGKGEQQPLSLPKEQWNEIAERTRVEYLAGFRQAINEVKKRKP
jgi:hypothetical protein